VLPALTTTDVRETSSATTRLLLAYVRENGGEHAVQRVLDQAGVPYPLEMLERASSWVSYDARIRLFQATVDVLGQPDVMFRVGAESLRRQTSAPGLVLLLRNLGSPAQVYRQLPRAVAKFSTTSTMRVTACTGTSATIEYRLREGYVHSRLDCDYARGLFTVVPQVFRLPAAQVAHEACESDGAPSCVYHVSWDRRSRWRRRSPSPEAVVDPELDALRAQLETLQLAAFDLVSSDDAATVLQRLTDRTAGAILAQGHLLVVHGPDGEPPLVRSSGVPAERLPDLARALLAGEDLGPSAVVVDVASTRRHHGRLAALYGPGQSDLGDEDRLLQAYAQHAAAALDGVLALEASRRGERRAAALLDLAHRLADAEDEQTVGRLVSDALVEVAGCASAAIWIWDGVRGVLQGAASSGLSREDDALVVSTCLDPSQAPELARLLSEHRAVVVDESTPSASLRALLAALRLEHVTVVPLVAGGDLQGVATASWPRGTAPAGTQPEVLLRLQGVGDQAATALQNTRLLTTVRHQALHDDLTGLPNRVLFADRLEQALAACARGEATAVGVLFCDLDRFKQVNDGLGHSAGDELLRQVAHRLTDAVGAGPSVGRLSGDEFAVLLPDVADLPAATAVARRVTEAFEHAFRVEGNELPVTLSVGVALHEGDAGRADQLLHAADAAMYVAKQRGRNQVASGASPRTSAPAGGGGVTERELRHALEHGELRLVFQPVLDVISGRTVGAEALVRWQHPRLGLLGPGSFLPLSAETGLGIELDRWVLRTACAALADEQRPDQHVAVNLSGRTLQEAALVGWVRDALRASGLPAAQLTLEVVESRGLTDLPRLAERLGDLRRLGVRVALDDFGTGYSTLTWLQRLPVDVLKVDRSFTESLGSDPAASGLVRGILHLAAELGLQVVVEGVETQEQLAVLHEVGCRLVQGYLLGRPAPGFPAPAGLVAAPA